MIERAAEGRRRAAVVFNPTKEGIDVLREAVAAAEKAAGWAPSLWLETKRDDPGKGMARAAHEQGLDLVIAAGGDGTVRSAAAALRGTGMPLGLAPAGTGNLLARNLDIPVNDPAAALRIAFEGAERAIDVTTIAVTRPDGGEEEHVSLVMAGVGIDAAMIAKTNSDLKKKVGWLAYVDAGLRVLPASKPFRVYYRIDERHVHRARVSTVLVANLGYLPGNIELIPDAEIDDAQLDVAVLQPRNAWQWLLIWRRVTWENRILRKSAIGRQYIDLTGGDKRREIIYLRGSRVRLDIDGEPQALEIDGDEFGIVRAVDFRTDAASLTVRVPEA